MFYVGIIQNEYFCKWVGYYAAWMRKQRGLLESDSGILFVYSIRGGSAKLDFIIMAFALIS